MKKTSRFVALILAVVMVLSIVPIAAIPASAANDASSNQPVVRMSIFSYTKWFLDTGHSWLYFENLTDRTLKIGAYTLLPYQSVSVGTFKLTRKDGAGVYYNVEAYCVNHFNTDGRVSYSMDLNEGQLTIVSKEILEKNKWNLAQDCAWFASTVWNSVASEKMLVFNLPSILKLSIMTHKGYKKNAPMFSPSASQVYKLTGGSNLAVVSSGTLKKGL